MYLGHDEMIHAPQSGDVVKIVSLHSPWNQQHYIGAIRPKA
jgi:cell wall-associated NlpC family hydrolase